MDAPAHRHTTRTWRVLLQASALAEQLEAAGTRRTFAADDTGRLVPSAGADVLLEWDPPRRWQVRGAADAPGRALLELYLPICGATAAHPITVGHLGQSLDGFIATHSGDSQFVTGADNLVHMHRLRALCSAVVVGAGTVASDDPQLTTRHVEGPNPLRVVFDPSRRLEPTYRVFTDADAPTLYVCGRSRLAAGETHVGRAEAIGFDDATDTPPVEQLVALLRARGHARIFVEGGGVTVSAFLDANLLDRLHIAIAPVLIGDGRPAVRITPRPNLRDCRRPPYRVFTMGGDVLFDCELTGDGDVQPPGEPGLTRVI